MGFRDLAEPMSGVEAYERNLAEDRPDRSPLTTYRAAAVAQPHNPAGTGGVEARPPVGIEPSAACARPPCLTPGRACRRRAGAPFRVCRVTRTQFPFARIDHKRLDNTAPIGLLEPLAALACVVCVCAPNCYCVVCLRPEISW